MDTLPPPLQWMRLTGLTILGRSTTLFNTFAKYGSGQETLVSSETGLCIEAPPRSGNSFFVMGFGMANPDVRLAHHHHVAAQVHRAMQLEVPVIALLRNPLDSALAKAAPGDKPFLVGTTLRRWVSFWRGIQNEMDSIVVARFEDVTSDPSAIIQRINTKYSTGFSTEFPATPVVFDAMEKHRIGDQGADVTKRPNPNIPSEEIKRREDALRTGAEAHRLTRVALHMYQSILRGLSSGD